MLVTIAICVAMATAYIIVMLGFSAYMNGLRNPWPGYSTDCAKWNVAFKWMDYWFNRASARAVRNGFEIPPWQRRP